MSAVNVVNLLLVVPLCIIIREFTLEKGLTCAVNAGNLLLPHPNCVVIRKVTLEKGLKSALNVGNLLQDKPNPFQHQSSHKGIDMQEMWFQHSVEGHWRKLSEEPSV